MKIDQLVIMGLFSESLELSGLDDTRENINAPDDQLTKGAQFIKHNLIANGITTSEQVDELFDKYFAPLINLIQNSYLP